MPTFTTRSAIATTPENFWKTMSMSAVNAELAPLVRMTAPQQWRDCPLEQWATGKVLFRSTLLLFGLIPTDLHFLKLERIDPEGGFLERSHSLVNRLWLHERTTEPTSGGCIVTDTVTVESRLPGMATLMLPIFRFIFRHRHRRLREQYGVARD